MTYRQAGQRWLKARIRRGRNSYFLTVALSNIETPPFESTFARFHPYNSTLRYRIPSVSHFKREGDSKAVIVKNLKKKQ